MATLPENMSSIEKIIEVYNSDTFDKLSSSTKNDFKRQIKTHFNNLFTDESYRQAYIDKYYNGNEGTFIASVNKFKDSGIVSYADYTDTFTQEYKEYYTDYVESEQGESLGDIFGDGADIGSDMSYEEKKEARSKVLQSVLGQEMTDIGLGKDPVSLIEFAEYQPITKEEKDLVQEGGSLSPLKDRREELRKISIGEIKEKTGAQTREMIKKTAQKAIPGLKTVVGSQEASDSMQSSFKKLADKASAQNAMMERISQLKDKEEATSKLSTMISDQLKYDISRKDRLKSSRAKAAVGLAGSQLTAQEHAAQLAKSTLL